MKQKVQYQYKYRHEFLIAMMQINWGYIRTKYDNSNLVLLLRKLNPFLCFFIPVCASSKLFALIGLFRYLGSIWELTQRGLFTVSFICVIIAVVKSKRLFQKLPFQIRQRLLDSRFESLHWWHATFCTKDVLRNFHLLYESI